MEAASAAVTMRHGVGAASVAETPNSTDLAKFPFLN